jgi:hypothetical protein
MDFHVYELAYYKVMTITVCDMQYENTKVQQIMWKKLIEMMLKHEFPKPNFKGFMVNNAQTNWNAVKIIYGSGNPLSRWLIRSAPVYSIGLNCSMGTLNN